MRLTTILLGFVFICAMIVVASPAPQDGDDVRGAFLTSRPKEKPATSGPTTKPSRRRPKPSATPKPPEKNPAKPAGPAVTSKAPESRPVNVPRLGLGLTLFARDSNGLAVRVDPDRVFRKGDRVRILLETNTDGYLYIFNTTNEGQPVMIYPEPDLDEAGNYVQAHVPFEVPSGAAAEERLRWFAFDEVAGTERLYFVFTREPLNGVPIEDELITLCRESKANCPPRPSTEVWELIKKQMQEPLKTDRSARYGGAQTTLEHEATTRGLGLAKDDPQPSLIMMASSTSPTLVATLDLIHK
jgi:hypothetical protein